MTPLLKRIMGSVGAATIAAFVLTGCGVHQRFGHDAPISYSIDPADAAPISIGRYGGSISSENQGDPKTFNIWVADDNISGTVGGMLSDSLVALNPYTLKYDPRLAYLPKISADGLTYTFTLRPGLKWSDGQPLTADDVVFTFKVLYDPKIVTLYRESLLIPVPQPDGSSKHVPFVVKKLDERTVQFVLPAKFAPALEAFGTSIMPKHSLEAAYVAGRFNNYWDLSTPPSQLVGCGPYVLDKYVPGQRVIYKTNPYFWRTNSNGGKLPYIPTYIYNITPNDNQEALQFQAGASDELTVPLHLYPGLARYARRDNYTLINSGPDWSTGFMTFNEDADSSMSKTPALLKLFQNKTFRQACSYALDRQTICDELELGLAEPLYGPVSSANRAYFNPNIPKYPYDPAKARAMLLGIGLKPGAGGMLTYEGQPVKFTILTSTEGTSKDIATIYTNSLRDIGLDVQQSNITFESLDTKISAKPYDWQAVIMGFGAGVEPNDIADLWRTTSVSHLWWPSEPHPEFAWEARIENDFNKGAQELDPAKRRQYYDDWQQVAADEQPMVFIDTPRVFVALRNHFDNIRPNSLTAASNGEVTWNIEQIYRRGAGRFQPY